MQTQLAGHRAGRQGAAGHPVHRFALERIRKPGASNLAPDTPLQLQEASIGVHSNEGGHQSLRLPHETGSG